MDTNAIAKAGWVCIEPVLTGFYQYLDPLSRLNDQRIRSSIHGSVCLFPRVNDNVVCVVIFRRGPRTWLSSKRTSPQAYSINARSMAIPHTEQDTTRGDT